MLTYVIHLSQSRTLRSHDRPYLPNGTFNREHARGRTRSARQSHFWCVRRIGEAVSTGEHQVLEAATFHFIGGECWGSHEGRRRIPWETSVREENSWRILEESFLVRRDLLWLSGGLWWSLFFEAHAGRVARAANEADDWPKAIPRGRRSSFFAG